MAGYVREYALGPLIGTTFEIYRKNFFKYFMVCILPFVVLQIAMGQIWGPEFWDSELAGDEVPEGYYAGVLLSSIVGMIIGAATLVTTAAIIEGKDVDAGQAFGRAISAFLKLIVFYLLDLTAVMIGFMLFIIPGVIAFIRLAFGWPAILIEDAGPIEALSRSVFLSKGNFWRLSGIILAVAIVLLLVMAVTLFVLILLGAVILPMDSVVAVGLFFGLIYGLFMPLTTIPWVLLYYDLRVREGEFDGPPETQTEIKL